MKKLMTAVLLIAALFMLSGCTAIDEALGKIGDDIEARQLEEVTPITATNGDMDWSFVPALREQATALFKEGFPNAEILEDSVACKKADRVIVTLTYMMDNRKGTYGFDYTLSEEGVYELTRYGDGVSSDDL